VLPEADLALPRRVLLAGVTALIVARPFVLGEDPGLLDRPLSDAAGMVLSLLWLLLAVAWALWRVWSGEGTWYSSLVDAPLAAVAGIVFASSAWAAEYKHPAWLIAWEWLILVVLFCLVRQLARTAGERRSLLAAIVATGVSISGQALYQYAIVLPQQRRLADNPQQRRQEASRLGLQADDPNLVERLKEGNVYATFAHPNSLAGYLALLLPAAVGWAVVCWRRFGLSWWAVGVAACALLIGTALWLTHSRGAILASLLVGAAVGVVRWRSSGWRYKGRVLAMTAGLAVVLVLVLQSRPGQAALAKGRASIELRLGYWEATWRMIREPQGRLRLEEASAKDAGERGPAQGASSSPSPSGPKPSRQLQYYPQNWVLGVGPGNFRNSYRRYRAPLATETIRDPHDFALEIWATSGVFALAALLLALLLFFWQTRYAWTDADSAPGPDSPGSPLDPDSPLGPLRWEFYLGGMAGLTLGFILQARSMAAEDVLRLGLVSGVSSLLWFPAFALLDNLLWQGPTQVLALVAGVAALLFNLCVSDGLSYPSVAQSLWTVAALALADRAPLRTSRHWLGLVAPLPIVAVVGLTYFFITFYPVAACDSNLADARSIEAYWREEIQPEWRQKLNQASTPAREKLLATQKARAYVDERIVKALRAAAEADDTDPYPQLQLAYWLGMEAHMLSQMQQLPDEPKQPGARTSDVWEQRWEQQRQLANAAILRAEQAWNLNPQGLEGCRMALQLYLMLAESPYWRQPSEDTAQAEKKRQRREVLYRDAAIVLRQLIRRDPSEAELRYRLANALFQAGDTAEGKEAAMEARQLRESQQISQRNPTEALLHYRLADALFQAGEPAEARFQAHQGRDQPQLEPPDPQLHCRLAEALFKAGDTDAGRFHAIRANEMDLPVLNPSERLTDPQHEQIKKWLEPAPTQ
jgi:hypothetical protein